MKIYKNIECGNLHLSFKEAKKEAKIMYDYDDDTNDVAFNELYERMDFPNDEGVYLFIRDNPGIRRMEIISELSGNITRHELDKALQELKKSGRIYTPDIAMIDNCAEWFAN